MTPYPLMRRISVVGSTGAGKTTAAREIGTALDLPVLEVESRRFHEQGWDYCFELLREFLAPLAGGSAGTTD